MSEQSKEQRYLQVFQNVTRLISMVLDHQQVMDTIVKSLPDLLDIDACSIRLLDGSTNTFVLGAAHGLSMEYLSRQSIDSEATMDMIKQGQPVAREVIDNDQLYQPEEVHREGIKSVLTLPILFQDSIIGMMRLLTKSHRVFSAEEVSFAMALAEQVGIAISNGRMFEEMESQVDFMREVQEISKLTNSTLDLDTVLQTIVERLPVSLQAKACTINLFNPQSKHLELVAANGLSVKYLHRCRVEKELNTEMTPSGEPVAIYDIDADDRVHYKNEMKAEGVKSLLAVPIKVKGNIIGILRILSDEHHCFTGSETNFAVTVAEASGTAIQNARMYTKISLLFNQIEESERFLSDILDCIRPQLIVLDRNRHVVLANRVFLEILGKTEAEVLGMEYYDICPIGQGENVCPADVVLKEGTSAAFTHSQEIDSEMHWIERTASPMFGKDGQVEYVIEIIRDVTAQKKLEEEQMERMKLEGVITMAGTVAHEINTPLFAALGTAQLMEDDLKDEGLLADLGLIVRNLKNISGLTRKMTAMTGFTSRDYVGDTKIMEL